MRSSAGRLEHRSRASNADSTPCQGIRKHGLTIKYPPNSFDSNLRGPRIPIMQDTMLRISGSFHSPQPRMRSCLESVLRLWQDLFPHGFARTQSDGSDHRTSPRAHGHLPMVGRGSRERITDGSDTLRGGQAIQIGLHSSAFCFDLLRSPIRVELSPNINCVHRESSAWIETGRLQKTFYS